MMMLSRKVKHYENVYAASLGIRKHLVAADWEYHELVTGLVLKTRTNGWVS